jgi:hypothetical protein
MFISANDAELMKYVKATVTKIFTTLVIIKSYLFKIIFQLII